MRIGRYGKFVAAPLILLFLAGSACAGPAGGPGGPGGPGGGPVQMRPNGGGPGGQPGGPGGPGMRRPDRFDGGQPGGPGGPGGRQPGNMGGPGGPGPRDGGPGGMGPGPRPDRDNGYGRPCRHSDHDDGSGIAAAMIGVMLLGAIISNSNNAGCGPNY